MRAGMRPDPSMNKRKGELNSPHMSIPMNGDVSKIEPLVPGVDNSVVSGKDAQSEKESREIDGSPTAGRLTSNDKFDEGYQPVAYRLETSDNVNVNEVSCDLQQASLSDAIFREPHGPTSWSTVVSSSAVYSPTRLTTRSSSGETLLTSNMAQELPQSNDFQYLGVARSRSHSFDIDTPPHYSNKSASFDSTGDNHQHQIGLGIPPSHPGHSSFKDYSLPNTLNQGNMHSSPMMYPATPYHQDFKPRSSSMGSYSPISLGDSMTEQTSPMSSPSLSPHVSPAMGPRKHHGDGSSPTPWHLSDTGDYHPDPSTMSHHRLHPNSLPQSIPEHQRHEPAIPDHNHSYMMPPHHEHVRSGPASPTRHYNSQAAASGHHHHYHQSMGYPPRRPGLKFHTSGPVASQAPGHHRSSTEVLKTLLRKKACLYEPETSFAVSLVTWLVGRQLALSQGYFTRQQLQAGVHSCVAGKIKEGHVTRTKVNRCMQVILNSCFHYIIPRPDGSEECGEAFRMTFSLEAAAEDHLLGTLAPPWNDLNLKSLEAGESPSSLFQESDDERENHPPSGKSPSKESSAASHTSDSLDSGGKRSVLLCFNENIRSAADVFRCHNEFIRDVAHTGHLNLSREDWQAFFSGTKSYRKKSASFDSYESSRHSHLAELHDRVDHHGLSKLRTTWCAKRYDHDHAFCAFGHVDTNRGWLRRDPLIYSYKPTMCPYIKPLRDADDCFVNMCPHGVNCNLSHSKEEILYHPENYKRQPCQSAPGACPLGDICPFAHTELPHGYSRQAKRHYHDHSPFHRATHSGTKRRTTNQPPRDAAGFRKLPDGSPMLYIDPAPLSEFEKTLLLPGLQAIFRDHSSSIFYSSMGESACGKYTPFGYRSTQDSGPTSASNLPIGKMLAC